MDDHTGLQKGSAISCIVIDTYTFRIMLVYRIIMRYYTEIKCAIWPITFMLR